MINENKAIEPATKPYELAPDFNLVDTQGNTVTLSNYRGKQLVVLVFNRGFT